MASYPAYNTYDQFYNYYYPFYYQCYFKHYLEFYQQAYGLNCAAPLPTWTSGPPGEHPYVPSPNCEERLTPCQLLESGVELRSIEELKKDLDIV